MCSNLFIFQNYKSCKFQMDMVQFKKQKQTLQKKRAFALKKLEKVKLHWEQHNKEAINQCEKKQSEK